MPLFRFHIESPWAGQGYTEEVFLDDEDPSEEELDAILDVVYSNSFPASITRVDEDEEDDEWD